MFRSLRFAEYLELVFLFFIQGAALGMWLVPLSGVLEAHGYQSIRPYAFASAALAAFVSPLIFGAMADRHASPVKVLRGLSLATALTMAMSSTAIYLGAPAWQVLGLIQLHALCSSPTWSISSSIAFARIADARKEFGPVRAMATFGWMAGCWVISGLNADRTVMSGFTGALTWLAVCGFTFFLPPLEVPKSVEKLSWSQRFGLDALTLLKNHDHRVVFIMVVLTCIPLASFYPYAPIHLREVGFVHTSAWMTLGQITEIFAMFGLGALLLKWRLKWIFACGLGFGVVRFAASSINGQAWLLLGILLHGAAYTLVLITAQIYLDQRVDSSWRTRAQALLSLLSSGVGNLLGYLGMGWWFAACTRTEATNWQLFWGVLALFMGGVFIYFVTAYHGRPADRPR